MPTDQVQTDHHFIVRSGVRSFQLDNGRIDITSAIDGAVYTYRRALFGHDAAMSRDQQPILKIRRGLVLRSLATELIAPDGKLFAEAREGTTLQVRPTDSLEFKIDAVDLSRSAARDSRFVYSAADVPAEVCGRLEKQNWLNASLEVKLPGHVPTPVALFSAWWMWRRWERLKAVA